MPGKRKLEPLSLSDFRDRAVVRDEMINYRLAPYLPSEIEVIAAELQRAGCEDPTEAIDRVRTAANTFSVDYRFEVIDRKGLPSNL